MARIAATLPTPASILVAVLTLISTLTPFANAAYVQWIRCPDGNGGAQGFGSVWPTANRARLLHSDDSRVSGQSGPRMEFGVTADYMGEVTCAELLKNGPSDITINLDALNLSKTYVVRPSNWTCVPYRDRPAWERRNLANNESQIRLDAQIDLEVFGLLPTFVAQLVFSTSDSNDTTASSACIYSEITPQLRKDVSTAVRYAPIGVFLLVVVSGLVSTLSTPLVSRRGRCSVEAAENESHDNHIFSRPQGVITQRTILPGVADCLLHLQFIFFLGALTLRYPGFYQPLTSLFHWSSLFSSVGPFGQDRRYNMVNDGIYEINGTLTGSYGLELMSQITGGPFTMAVWWNMVLITAIITAVVAAFVLVRKPASQLVPSLRFLAPAEKGFVGQGPVSDSAIARGTWSVLRVVLSYFLAPIVAISAYQLDNVILPAYHLALATLLIVLVMMGVVWMWRTAPSNHLWALLLDSSKRYRLAKTGDPDTDSDPGRPDTNRDIFAGIFFALVFARGIAVGGFQFSPLAQVIGLAATETALLVSTAVLRPLRGRTLSLFTWLGVARLLVVALTAVFLPELDVSISVRSRVAIAILVIHAAVLVLGCAMPATIRLADVVRRSRNQDEEPQIYGLRQLIRRDDVVNNLSANRITPESGSISNSMGTDSPASYHSHNRHSDTSLDWNSPPDDLYLRAISPHHYFRPPIPTSSSLRPSHQTSRRNVSPVISIKPLTLELGSSCQGDGSPARTSSPPTTSPGEAHQASSIFGTNATISDVTEPPLSPPIFPIPPLALQWSDYSFREADLYYGHGRLQYAGDFCATTATADVGPQPESSTVRRVVSQLMAWKSRWIQQRHKGFEVQRPPKPDNV